MHEYPITKRIIEVAEQTARENGASQVKAIHLVVGDYCGYVASSIDLYFELIAEDTLCKNAKLLIERIKPQFQCGGCGQFFERKPFSFTCPHCDGEGSPTEVGKEFYIKSIEV